MMSEHQRQIYLFQIKIPSGKFPPGLENFENEILAFEKAKRINGRVNLIDFNQQVSMIEERSKIENSLLLENWSSSHNCLFNNPFNSKPKRKSKAFLDFICFLFQLFKTVRSHFDSPSKVLHFIEPLPCCHWWNVTFQRNRLIEPIRFLFGKPWLEQTTSDRANQLSQ